MHKDPLIHMMVQDRTMFATEMKDKAYVQQIIFDSLVTQSNNKHLWIKKATGLGISEFMLRFMAWLCLKDNSL
jgi:hypothetical protein